LQQYLRRCAVRQQGFYACSIDWDRNFQKTQEKQPMMWYHRSITGRTIEEYL